MPASGLRDRLQTRLRFAMKDRDTVAVAALRGALAAMDASATDGEPISTLELVGIVRDEVTERETAAIAYARAGEGTRAESLRAEAAILRALLDTD